MFNVFSPTGATVNVAVSTTSARVARTTLNQPDGAIVRLANTGTETCFVSFGDDTVTATAAAGIPILGGTVEAFSVSQRQTHVAAITGTGTTTLYVTTGKGA